MSIQEIWPKFKSLPQRPQADNFVNRAGNIIIYLMKPMLILLIVLLLTGCSTGYQTTSIPPAVAQQTARAAWQSQQHTVWQLEWPDAPLYGTLTVEMWQQAAARRLEILEASAPGVWGQTMVFDGQTAWLFNRFEPAPPVKLPTAQLSPITDAFHLIETRLDSPPQRATLETTTVLQHGPTQKITLFFSDAGQLTIWLESTGGLPVRVRLTGGPHQFTLKATYIEKTTNFPPGLFKPPAD